MDTIIPHTGLDAATTPETPGEDSGLMGWVFGGALLAGAALGAYYFVKKGKATTTDNPVLDAPSGAAAPKSQSSSQQSAPSANTTAQEQPTSGEILEYPHYGETNQDGVNFRQQPTTKSGIYMAKVAKGFALTILARVEGESVKGNTVWFKIDTKQGDRYVHSSLVGNFKRIVKPGAAKGNAFSSFLNQTLFGINK